MASDQFKLNSIDRQLIDLALKEDLQREPVEEKSDITTHALFKTVEKSLEASIISKSLDPIVLCGLPVIETVLKKFPHRVKLIPHYVDGSTVLPKEIILTLRGHPKTLLMAERTLLNFLRHLSAIATLTKKFVDAAKGTPLKILDTRKTTPGMRHLEKYAVQCGGGINHRMGLYDAYMIKDTHVDLIGGMKRALEHLPSRSKNKRPVIVEVRNREELETVMAYGQEKVTRVLLDNMPPALLKTCVQRCRGHFETEASGNINLKTIRAIAKTGVNYVSIGMLTYGAGQADLAMIVK